MLLSSLHHCSSCVNEFFANSATPVLGFFSNSMVSARFLTNSMSLSSLLSLIAFSFKNCNSTSLSSFQPLFMQAVDSALLEPVVNRMPSENSFKQHVERVRGALKNFNAIRILDAPGPIKTALDELIALDVEFTKFTTFFSTHALFLEVPPAVFQALDDFFTKNPTYERPPDYKQVIGLNARAAREVAAQAASTKRGMSFVFFL
jgi:hypothetical protein